MKADIVVDVGFGDSGKGSLTNALCENEDTVVVRYCGGHQAGHTVYHNDYRHVFSSYGSGTLKGCRTFFSQHTLFHPLNMMRERNSLLKKVPNMPCVYFHPFAKATTPYDVAFGRLLAERNGHGSCGLGIGTTMTRNERDHYTLHAVDFLHKSVLWEKLDKILHYYVNLAQENGFLPEFISISEQEDMQLYADWLNIDDFVFIEELPQADRYVFEGSQGVLLDMDHGIFPNVTYANTTSKNAIEICREFGIDDIEMFYVTRCYGTRHGNGWVPNNSEIKLVNNEEETNIKNLWQGEFRVFELDPALVHYALKIDAVYSGGAPSNLCVTCMDQRPDYDFPAYLFPDMNIYTCGSKFGEFVCKKRGYADMPINLIL